MAKYVFSVLSACVCLQSVFSLSGADVQCDKPPEFERSRPCEKDEEFPVGKKIRYCCDPGFRFSSSGKPGVCVLDDDGVARWNIPTHHCQAVSCSPPDPIENGYITGSRYTFPNSVKYACNKGYELRGINTRYCETTGEWSGRKPHCQIVTCPEPERIENGKVTYSSTEYSSKAKYECVSGYRIDGKSERQCTHERVWEGNVPSCVEVTCAEPNDPINGKVIIHSGTRKDNYISFTCDEGTQLIGASLIKCMDDGKWSADPPLCTKPCIVPRLGRGKLGKEELAWSWGSRRRTFSEVRPGNSLKHGDKLLLRCYKGYELPVEDLKPGDIEVVCDGGTFKPVPACHPAWCRGPLPDNGRGIPPSPPYNKESGSVVEYEDPCANIGETLRRKTASCYMGTWSITDEICHDPRCNAKNLEEFSVEIHGNEFYSDGELLDFQCKNGYEKAFVDEILCSNGQWQITHPPCKPASCKYPPPEIHKGKAQVSSYEHGTNVKYSCFDSYQLVSRGRVTCSYGQWDGTLPTCQNKPCTVPKLYHGKMGIEEKSDSRRFQQIYPRSSIMSGEKLLLRCNKEYELPIEDLPPGDVEVICDGGDFKPTPSCHRAWCRGPLPDNGRGIPPLPPYNKESGSVLVYSDSCLNIGRTLQEKSVLCVRGKWVVTDEVCEDSRCKARDLENVHIDTSGEEFFGHGQVMEFRCKIGYEKSSEESIRCINGHWQITNPPCKAAFCRYPPPEVDYGKATVSFGEHGTIANYTCFPPYELVSKGSVTCSRGQWMGTLPVCKDTRCNTYSLSKNEGVKLENKMIKNNGVYSPACRDGYDNLHVELRCINGKWGHSDLRNPEICKPGECIVPYVAYGDFFFLQIKSGWFSDTRNLIKIDVNSTARHNSELHFKCQGELKFQGKFKTDGDGIKVTCRNKQWIPKPECWYFPQTTTAAPATTEQSAELMFDNSEVKTAMENNTVSNETDEDEKNLNENVTAPSVMSQNNRKNCKYDNDDEYLLIFFEDQVTSKGIFLDGSIIKFGCQPIGYVRLQGPASAVCFNGEWKPNDFPRCFRPLRKNQVSILLSTNKHYETRPGDIAVVPKHSVVEISCFDLIQKREVPHLYHKNEHITGSYKRQQDGFIYSSIRLENMTEEYTGTYICSSGNDSHTITIVLADTKGKTFCPSLNTTDRVLINYDSEEQRILPGTRATFYCEDVMSELQGMKEIICLKNGNWSSSPPICVRRCLPLPNIENGYKDGDAFTVGSEVTYGCNKGYKLIGRGKMTCQENNLWSANLPRCSVIRCSTPAKVDNAELDFNSLSFDARIEYKCKSGYELIGNSTSRCNENGEWTNRPPVCKVKSKQCYSYDLADNLPEGVFGGNITEDYMPSGSVIQLICGHQSQIIVGDKHAFCTHTGHWRVGHTKCVIGCKAVEKPHNSSLIIEGVKDTYRFGDYITFSCPEGKQLSIDLQRIVCLSTGWSDDNVPECVSPNP